MGCATCAKCLLVLINIIVVILGLGILAVGIVAKTREDLLLELISEIPVDVVRDILEGWNIEGFLASVSNTFLIVGSVVFLIGFCGCCGAITSNICLLVIYAIIVGVILLGQIAIGILIGVFTPKVENQVKEILQDSLKAYTSEDGGVSVDAEGGLTIGINKVKLAWDGSQILLRCCGVEEKSDYLGLFSGNYDIINGTAVVPISCCTFIGVNDYQVSRARNKTTRMDGIAKIRDSAQMCLEDADKDHTHTQGCYSKVISLIKQYWDIAIAILVITLFIELLGFISACIVMKASRDDKVV